MYPGQVGALDGGGGRQGAGQRLLAGELPAVESRRQLEQGQRVASGAFHQPVQRTLGDGGGEPLGQQGSGVGRSQRSQSQLRQAGCHQHGGLVVPGGEQQHHGLRVQPAGGEDQRVHRGSVQPLGVVDQAEQGAVLGDLGEQPENAEGHPEALVDRFAGEREGRPQCRRLRLGQALDLAEGRSQDLVQRCVRELVLRLDADAAQHSEVRGALGGVRQERGLAQAGPAAHHEHAAAALPCGGKQCVDLCRLGRPTHERARLHHVLTSWQLRCPAIGRRRRPPGPQ